MKTFNGITLLEKIQEFIAMTPDIKNWNYEALSNNMPRLIRLKQIGSLLKAFSLTNHHDPDFIIEIHAFLNGHFIMNRKLEVYQELLDFVKQFLHERDQEIKRPISLMNVNFIYPKMLDFRKKLIEILSFNSSWMEASSPLSVFHILLTGAIGNNLVDKYNDLDKTLELIINPEKKVFTEQELIEHYNYPTEDLHEIDMDNY